MATNVTAELDQKCKKSVEHFRVELGKIRSGRASASLLEGIRVDYYGSQVPLNQLGNVSAPEPRMIIIQVYDASAMDSIEKAIHQSELGLNPSRDGGSIRLVIPPLNADRRKELVKKLSKMTEELKVVIRNHRRDAIEALKKAEKNKEISEDDRRRREEEVQKSVDKYSKDADVLFAQKEKEILEV